MNSEGDQRDLGLLPVKLMVCNRRERGDGSESLAPFTRKNADGLSKCLGVYLLSARQDETANRLQSWAIRGFSDIELITRQGTPYSKADADSAIATACISAMEQSGYPKNTIWPIFPGSGPAYLFTDPPVSLPDIRKNTDAPYIKITSEKS